MPAALEEVLRQLDTGNLGTATELEWGENPSIAKFSCCPQIGASLGIPEGTYYATEMTSLLPSDSRARGSSDSLADPEISLP